MGSADLGSGIVMNTFNSSTRRQRQTDLFEFEVSPIYRAGSKTARVTQNNPVKGREERHLK